MWELVWEVTKSIFDGEGIGTREASLILPNQNDRPFASIDGYGPVIPQ